MVLQNGAIRGIVQNMDRRIGYARRVSTRRGDTTPNYSQISKMKKVHNVKRTIVSFLLAVTVLLRSKSGSSSASTR